MATVIGAVDRYRCRTSARCRRWRAAKCAAARSPSSITRCGASAGCASGRRIAGPDRRRKEVPHRGRSHAREPQRGWKRHRRRPDLDPMERRGLFGPATSTPSLLKEARMVHATKPLPDSDDKIDAAVADGSAMTMIVVTVDHVYLPLDEDGNGRADWAVTSVETTRVSTSASGCKCRPTWRSIFPSAIRRRSSDDPASARLESGNRRRVVVARGRRGQLGEAVVPAHRPPARPQQGGAEPLRSLATPTAMCAWWRVSR